MVWGEFSATVARERIAALWRQADQARLARSRPPAAAVPCRGGMSMLIEHPHKPGVFDPGHCRDCARQSDLLDHYHHVQRQEQALTQAHRWARQARRHALLALWSAGVAILLAAVALRTF